MEVYVKETLHVLDYQDNIKHTIFNSDDHITAGYAYNINISEANTGYSDLKFEMPHDIINDKGEKVHNPMLELMVPLVKLRYHRQVFYTGTKPITVREPQGYGDTTVYVDKVYSNTYPDNIIEDYVMDYIVQPVDKKRDVQRISTTFTAIDYPRFNLSKKRVGLTIGQDTLTKPEWSIYTNEPMSVPGKIKYIPWTQSLNNLVGRTINTSWDPAHDTTYPLEKADIEALMSHESIWTYGLLGTAFYWPITSTARFKGVMYKENGYLILQLYDFYAQTTKGINPDLYIGRYSWDWTQLYEMDNYLCPNNALNYLRHILNGTNWSVAMRQDGVTPDVDIIQTKVANPKGSTVSYEWVDLQSNISISNGNCYNAITTLCKELQVYPVFDCVNRTIALRQFAGKNYGLSYWLGSNLKDDTVKLDGEKVITKLYCTGGKDYDGDANINIGNAERSYIKYFTGFYNTEQSLPTVDVEGFYAIVDTSLPDIAFRKPTYKYGTLNGKKIIKKIYSTTEKVHDLNVYHYWEVGTNRKVFYWENNTWNVATQIADHLWQFYRNGTRVLIDDVSGVMGEWNPNDPMYIFGRSPAKSNYILNFEWMYRNKWMTQAQILQLYQYEQEINNLNLFFVDQYQQSYADTRKLYNEAVNNYDIAQDGFESTLHKMENKYYNEDGKYSEGYTYAFHKVPQGTYLAWNSSLNEYTHYIKLFHCYACGKTQGLTPNNGNAPEDRIACDCGSLDISNEAIYIPSFDDYSFIYDHDIYPYTMDTTVYNDGSYRYDPHLKGDYLSMVISMDKLARSDSTHQTEWTIGDYENAISLLTPIPFQGDTVTWDDGYDYKLKGVYVRSTSGKIENWNDDINNYLNNYGKMLNFLRDVLENKKRMEELDQLYDSWKQQVDDLHAIIQEYFGDYLIEGNYTNNEQPYIGLLFNEGLEASDKYSIPKITYDLNVVDASGLAEYRNPYTTLEHCIDCGWVNEDRTWHQCPHCGGKLEPIHDDYNDLVKQLHSIGQIIPKAGDYVTVYDEPMGMFGIPALITEIDRRLDQPTDNQIKVNTSYTDDKELVGNIITATNTVLNNADIYARTTILKGDGTIDPISLVNSFNNNGNNIAIVGTDGNMLLDSTGMRVTNSSNPNKAIKYSGNGIFLTSNFSTDSNEAVIWERMLSDEGIDASYIRSGSIDTNRLTILSGQYGKVVLDQYGLSVKQDSRQLSHVGAFDEYAAMNVWNYAANWGAISDANNPDGRNIAAFIGVDKENDPLIYTRGIIVARQGSNIANWVTSNNGFYHLIENTTIGAKDLWLSPTGISGTVSGNTQLYSFYANGNFGVTPNGKLYATSAEISGKIEITDNDVITISPSGYNGRVTINSSTYSDGPWAIYSKGNFGVTTGGVLWAVGGKFGGQIESESGHIGGWEITSGKLMATADGKVCAVQAPKSNITNVFAAGGTSHSDYSDCPFRVTKAGKLYASSVEISGKITATSGTIGGCAITDGVLKIGNANITNLSADKITTGSLNAARISGGIFDLKSFQAWDSGSGVSKHLYWYNGTIGKDQWVGAWGSGNGWVGLSTYYVLVKSSDNDPSGWNSDCWWYAQDEDLTINGVTLHFKRGIFVGSSTQSGWSSNEGGGSGGGGSR